MPFGKGGNGFRNRRRVRQGNGSRNLRRASRIQRSATGRSRLAANAVLNMADSLQSVASSISSLLSGVHPSARERAMVQSLLNQAAGIMTNGPDIFSVANTIRNELRHILDSINIEEDEDDDDDQTNSSHSDNDDDDGEDIAVDDDDDDDDNDDRGGEYKAGEDIDDTEDEMDNLPLELVEDDDEEEEEDNNDIEVLSDSDESVDSNSDESLLNEMIRIGSAMFSLLTSDTETEDTQDSSNLTTAQNNTVQETQPPNSNTNDANNITTDIDALTRFLSKNAHLLSSNTIQEMLDVIQQSSSISNDLRNDNTRLRSEIQLPNNGLFVVMSINDVRDNVTPTLNGTEEQNMESLVDNSSERSNTQDNSNEAKNTTENRFILVRCVPKNVTDPAIILNLGSEAAENHNRTIITPDSNENNNQATRIVDASTDSQCYNSTEASTSNGASRSLNNNNPDETLATITAFLRNNSANLPQNIISEILNTLNRVTNISNSTKRGVKRSASDPSIPAKRLDTMLSSNFLLPLSVATSPSSISNTTNSTSEGPVNSMNVSQIFLYRSANNFLPNGATDQSITNQETPEVFTLFPSSNIRFSNLRRDSANVLFSTNGPIPNRQAGSDLEIPLKRLNIGGCPVVMSNAELALNFAALNPLNNRPTSSLPCCSQAVHDPTTTTTSTENTNSSEDLKCPICLDTFSQLNERMIQLTAMTCGHVLCDPCFAKLVMAHPRRRPKCPICRNRINRI